MTHVLVVEDERFSRMAVSIVFKKAGYRVTAVEDGRQALEAIESNLAGDDPVQVLVTDIQMPVMTGMELLDELKKRGIVIPSIALTGNEDEEIKRDLAVRGCRRFIGKPFEPQQLMAALSSALEDSSNSESHA